MASGRQPPDPLTYSSSARRDVRFWAMFVVGAVFVIASVSIDPQTNCSEDGECAPWLVPIALVLGAAVGLGGLGFLLANPNRGSRIDSGTGELVWWQYRFGNSGGDEGRIDPAQIGKIRVTRQSDNADEVHLYDRDGVRQFYFDEEVIGWDKVGWAEAMRSRWPHIAVEVEG